MADYCIESIRNTFHHFTWLVAATSKWFLVSEDGKENLGWVYLFIYFFLFIS